MKNVKDNLIKVNRTNITDHLIIYELEMIGKTIDDVKGDERWYSNNTMTQEQHDEFRAYAIPLLKKIFKFNKGKAESTFSWFDMMYGLKIE
jgi:hypothetical protein